jgi:hypothetical protein
MTHHRVVTWPWLRGVGRVALRDWLAITIGHTIFAWRALTDDELEHELEHVRQWSRFGPSFPIAYLGASVRARRSGGRWYRDNRFEAEAREAVARRRRA